MTAQSNEWERLIPVDSMVLDREVELLCVRCNYDLRGLELKGRCPECGIAIRATTASGTMAILDPAWLDRLRLGSRLVKVLEGFWWLFVLPVILLWQKSGYTGRLFLSSWIGAFLLIVAASVWFFCQPSRLRVMSRSTVVSAWIARTMSGLVVLTNLLCIGLIASDVSTPYVMTAILVGSPIGVVGMVGGIAFGLYCRDVATLISADSVANRADQLVRIYAIGCVFGLKSAVLGFVVGSNVAVCGLLLGVCCQLIAGVMILGLPVKLEFPLRRLRSDANDTWSKLEADAR